MLRFENLFNEYGGVTVKQMHHVHFDALVKSEIARFAKSLQLHVNLCGAARH